LFIGGARLAETSPGWRAQIAPARSNGSTPDYGGGSTEAYNYLASVKGATTPHAATASLAVARQNAKVTTSGALTVKVTCSGAPCSGTFKLTTRVKKATIVTIGSGSFSRLTLGAHSVSLKLNSTGLRTLRQNGYRLSSTATAMYMSGSKTKTAGAAVSLKGTKPKSKKR
jgi:hypothetical protein